MDKPTLASDHSLEVYMWSVLLRICGGLQVCAVAALHGQCDNVDLWCEKTRKHHSTIGVPPMSLHATLPFTHGAHIDLCYMYLYTSILPAEKGMQLLPPVVVPRRSDSVVID